MAGPLIGMCAYEALSQKRVASGVEGEKKQAAHPHISSPAREAAAQAPGLFKRLLFPVPEPAQMGLWSPPGPSLPILGRAQIVRFLCADHYVFTQVRLWSSKSSGA